MSNASGIGLLKRAIALAKLQGMTSAEFARSDMHVSPVTLWRIKVGKRALTVHEKAFLRRYIMREEMVAKLEAATPILP